MTLPKTPSQTVGPFFAFGLCDRPQNALAGPSAADAIRIYGRVLDGAGEPVPDALVEIWQPGEHVWGRCGTDPEGGFEFLTVKPPAAGGEAPHIEAMVFARGLLRQVVTRIYFADEEEANATDPLLASLEPERRQTLLAVPGDGGYRFDVRLQGKQETVFFAL